MRKHTTSTAAVPAMPRVSLAFARTIQRAVRPNRVWSAVAQRLEGAPWAYRGFTALEKLVKGKLFGCRMCGQCALPSTAYASR